MPPNLENSKDSSVHFTKYTATGNDFVIIDDRDLRFPHADHGFIRRILHRRFGVGGDGLILLQPSDHANFRMRHFNPDGSEAEMCGNGARSLLHFAHSLGLVGKHTTFESHSALHKGTIDGEQIRIKMNPPQNLMPGKPRFELPGMTVGGSVEIGVPHYVLFVAEVASVDVQLWGSELAHRPAFPKGTNVDFVQVHSPNEINMRTFERGVEAETLSCGTGATASSVIASYLQGIQSPVTVHVLGGALSVEFNTDFSELWLCGPVVPVFRGELLLTAAAEIKNRQLE